MTAYYFYYSVCCTFPRLGYQDLEQKRDFFGSSSDIIRLYEKCLPLVRNSIEIKRFWSFHRCLRFNVQYQALSKIIALASTKEHVLIKVFISCLGNTTIH